MILKKEKLLATQHITRKVDITSMQINVVRYIKILVEEKKLEGNVFKVGN